MWARSLLSPTLFESTGTHYNYFRDYDPAIGRYVQSDPEGLRAGISTFSYVDNDPMDGIDPTGLSRMYGMWCGPEWTGGHKKSFDRLTLHERVRAKQPIDPLDIACRTHDICYGGCRAE